MKWGIIGLGHMAKNFANSINELEESQLIGVSTRSLFKLIKFGYRFRIKPNNLYKNYKKLLASEDIQNVYIGTLNHSHFEIIKEAINAGKNILCEKPVTINLEQVLEVREKLINSKVFFMEGIAYRSHPQINYIVKLIKQNAIGKIVKIKSCFGFNAGKPNKKGRLYNKDLGGGSILDLGCYPVSISNLIANLNNEKENLPLIDKVKGEFYETGVDTDLYAELKYPNGILSEIQVSITKNLENTTTIFGTDGVLTILDPWLPKKESTINLKKKNEQKELKSLSDLSLFANQIDIFEKIVKNKSLQSNYHSMNIDNSVNCMNILMQLKKRIENNENC